MLDGTLLHIDRLGIVESRAASVRPDQLARVTRPYSYSAAHC
jgi:hypothetical protein